MTYKELIEELQEKFSPEQLEEQNVTVYLTEINEYVPVHEVRLAVEDGGWVLIHNIVLGS